MKKILNFILMTLILLSTASAATYFDSFKVTFADDKPEDMKIMSYQCSDTSCTQATSANVEYYLGDSIQCWFDYGQSGQANEYLACMETYKLPGNTLDLNDCNTISDSCSGDVYLFAKYDINVPFGYVNYLFTKGDTYIPHEVSQSSFSCGSDFCVDINAFPIHFNKIPVAEAEIGQLNVKNIDNPLLPVQVDIPVTIDETVCSAFRFSNDKFKPAAPVGYSDYSADTNIELTITNDNTNEVLSNEVIMLPIKADTCAQLTAFTWTPEASLLDVPVKFRVDTDVIDSQVSSSVPDFAEVIEVVYPIDLSDSCWSRAYDFTLTNTNSFDLTTSVAQITEGEYLYSLFRAAAFCGNDNTPVPYTVDL